MFCSTLFQASPQDTVSIFPRIPQTSVPASSLRGAKHIRWRYTYQKKGAFFRTRFLNQRAFVIGTCHMVIWRQKYQKKGVGKAIVRSHGLLLCVPFSGRAFWTECAEKGCFWFSFFETMSIRCCYLPYR